MRGAFFPSTASMRALPGLAQPGRSAVAGHQCKYRGMGQIRAQRPFQGRMDAQQQVADPVGRGGDLVTQIIVVAHQHGRRTYSWAVDSDEMQEGWFMPRLPMENQHRTLDVAAALEG